MKTLVLLVAAMALSASQSGGTPIAGSWTAQFEGRTFLRLELKAVNGTITGGMSLGDFEVDGQGEVRRADEAPRDLKPLLDVAYRKPTLTFSRRDVTETDRFELRLLEAGHAELRFLLSDADRKDLAASGIPDPKPIRLTRQ